MDGPKANGGTGVYFPAALQAALKKSTSFVGKGGQPNQKASASPVGTPKSCSRRSSSFSSSTSTAAPGAGMQTGRKPPQHSASCRVMSGQSATSPVASTARKSPGAGAGQAHSTLQPAYGRFSLEDDSCRRAAPAPHAHGVVTSSNSFTSQSCSNRKVQQPVWPNGPTMRNSLSVPSLSTGSVPSFGFGKAQQDFGNAQHESVGAGNAASWTAPPAESSRPHAVAAPLIGSTPVSVLPLHNSSAQVLEGNMHLHSQRLHGEQLLAQQQQQQQQLQEQVQNALEQQLLLQQLGAMSSQPCSQQVQAGNLYVSDSVLMPQLQGPNLSRPSTGAGRRLSYTALPLSGTGLNLTDGSMLSSNQGVAAQLRQAASTSLPAMDADSTRDALDSALEAELDAALQQLLTLRNEVELRKARAGAAVGSSGISSVPAAPAASAAMLGLSAGAPDSMLAAGVQPDSMLAAGMQPDSMLAAGVQLGQLYQHTTAPALSSVPPQLYQAAAPQATDKLGCDALFYAADPLTAEVLSSQLYQPSAAGATLACQHSSVGSTPGPSAAAHVCMADVLARTSLSGFAPVMSASCAPLGDFGMGVPAALLFASHQVIPGSDGCSLQSSLGQPLAHEGTMADWLSSNTAAQVAAARRSLQQELQLSAAAQGGLGGLGMGQLSTQGCTPRASFELRPQSASFDLRPQADQGLYMHAL